jgi:hypothetical protein
VVAWGAGELCWFTAGAICPIIGRIRIWLREGTRNGAQHPPDLVHDHNHGHCYGRDLLRLLGDLGGSPDLDISCYTVGTKRVKVSR